MSPILTPTPGGQLRERHSQLSPRTPQGSEEPETRAQRPRHLERAAEGTAREVRLSGSPRVQRRPQKAD